MNENQNIPGKEPVPGMPTESSINQPQQIMEVHHHGHVHEKKKWKEYIFQFIMLFLAVFLGFLAENFREEQVEKNVEKEYIESLVADLKGDYDLAARIENSVFEQTKKVDTLQDLLFTNFITHPMKDSLIRRCYELLPAIKTFYSQFFNERTITQLLSSGGMRLIKTQGVADSIMDYHSYIKFIETQKQAYINSVTACNQSVYTIYDISFLKTVMYDDQYRYPDMLQYQLLPVSTNELKNFIATLETMKIIGFTYKGYMTYMMERSERLYDFLVKKYDLKE